MCQYLILNIALIFILIFKGELNLFAFLSFYTINLIIFNIVIHRYVAGYDRYRLLKQNYVSRG